MLGKTNTARTLVLAQGKAVYLRRPVAHDATRFCALMQASRRLHGSWVQPPLTALEFAGYLTRSREPDSVGLLICRSEDHDIAGVFNFSYIVRGALHNAFLGYYAAAEHAGCGYMREGMQLVVRFAFRMLKLHRIEANIQPENARSRTLAQGAGFRLEGLSPRYIKLAGRWRDHERWASWPRNGNRHRT